MASRYQADSDSAHVKFPPPLMLLLCLVAGGLIHFLHPVLLLPDNLRWIPAIPMIVVGLGIVAYSAKLFKKADTKLQPWKTTSAIVQSGAYKFSRNPIYLSFLIFGLGISFAWNSLWMALSLIPLWWLLTKLVIEKEEEYLEKKFGKEYVDYKTRVGRWL